MSTPPPYPQQPQYPQYPGYQAPPPRRNKALPWLVGGAVVVVAAIVVTLVLVLGDDGDDKGGGTASDGTSYDLSSPEKAAESIAAAAKAGDADAFLNLTCVGTPQCIEEHGENPSKEDVDSLRERIRDNLGNFAEEIEGASFHEATETSMPGVMEVSYETPDMVAGDERGLTFVQVNGKWLWFGSSGGSSGSGGAGGEGGGGHPGDASVVPDPHEPTVETTTTISCPPPESTDDGNPFPEHPPVEGCPR